MKKRLPWWQNLQIIAWSVGGLTAAGALIVGTARYINLPREVEAAVQKNTQQDDALNKLGTIAEQNQKLLDKWDGIYQQQQRHAPNQQAPARTVTPQEWQDPKDGSWWCCSQFCDADENWSRCE